MRCVSVLGMSHTLFRLCANNMTRRCVHEARLLSILEACHLSPVGEKGHKEKVFVPFAT